MNLNDFLRACGAPAEPLFEKNTTKLVRHVEPKFDLDQMISDGCFDDYQARQASDVFNCTYIVSWAGVEVGPPECRCPGSCIKFVFPPDLTTPANATPILANPTIPRQYPPVPCQSFAHGLKSL